MPIRSTDECIGIENASHIIEIDLVAAQIAFTFPFVPSERANAREQFRNHVVRHGQRLSQRSESVVLATEVRHDGFESAGSTPNFSVPPFSKQKREKTSISTVPQLICIYICIDRCQGSHQIWHAPK
jgi:hypothetical protein